MPITQSRIIALVDEGLAIRQTLVAFRDEIRTTLRQHREDPLMAITLIEGTVALLQIPKADNILAESTHYRYTARANERNRDRLRRQRGTGASPRNAPLSILRPLEDSDLRDLLDQDTLAEYEKWNRGDLK